MPPRFKIPAARRGTYSSTETGHLYKVTVTEGAFGRVELTEPAGLSVTSNNPKVVPMDDAVFRRTNNGGVMQIDFYGLSGTDTSMLEARRNQELVAHLQLHVQSIGGKRAFFQLEEPQLALHAPDTPVKYKLKYAEMVARDKSAEDIGYLVARRTAVNHLVISAHSAVDRGVFLDLGTGFRTAQDFEVLGKACYPAVRHVIWLGACAICGPPQGIELCKTLARSSGCFVVAPGLTLPPATTGVNEIEVFTRSLPHYFDREGKQISYQAFLKQQSELAFSLKNVING